MIERKREDTDETDSPPCVNDETNPQDKQQEKTTSPQTITPDQAAREAILRDLISTT